MPILVVPRSGRNIPRQKACLFGSKWAAIRGKIRSINIRLTSFVSFICKDVRLSFLRSTVSQWARMGRLFPIYPITVDKSGFPQLQGLGRSWGLERGCSPGLATSKCLRRPSRLPGVSFDQGESDRSRSALAADIAPAAPGSPSCCPKSRLPPNASRSQGRP